MATPVSPLRKARRRRQWRNRALGFGCLTLVVGAVVAVFVFLNPISRLFQGFSGGPPSDLPGWQDVAVKRGTVTDGIQAYGLVRPVREVSLAFRVAKGQIKNLMAEPGMPVMAGQPLIELDREALERELARARAELLKAQDELKKLEGTDNALRKIELEVELNKSQAMLDEARRDLAAYEAGEGSPQAQRTTLVAELNAARTALEVLRNSAERKEQIDYLQWIYNQAEVKHGEMAALPAPSEKDRDITWLLRNEMLDKREALEQAKLQYQMDLRQAEQAVAQAQFKLQQLDRQLKLGIVEVERAKRVAAVKQAEAAVQQIQAQLAALDQGATGLELAQARAKVLELEGDVQDAEAAIEDAQLIAPFDGIVTEVNALPNALVSPGTALVKLQDTSSWQIVAQVSEVDISRLKTGMPARLRFDAFVDIPPIEGQLGEIPGYGKYENGITVFNVPVMADVSQVPLMQGMSANILIPLREKKDVLTIPAAAIMNDPKGTFVWLVQGERSEIHYIEVGINDGILAEVVSGLKEGDVVRTMMMGPRPFMMGG